jgi:pseudouridine-5'-phosphate glycosidase
LEGESALVLRATTRAVALETAFLTTGLPRELRMEAAERIRAVIRAQQAEPAFVGVLGGKPIVGLTSDELEVLARQERKLSTRDLPTAMARGEHGGTTVAATLFLAQRAGLAVAATGGIGGVHPTAGPPDVSADLYELARTPIILVCSGAKAIMDLPNTLERLETLGVALAGFGTDEFPAFWSAESGLPLELTVDSAAAVVEIWRAARALGTPGALLVAVPPPSEAALDREEAEAAVTRALADLEAEGISGPAVTPFLLNRVAHYTEGRSVRANLGTLENNAAVAASIARAMAAREAVG